MIETATLVAALDARLADEHRRRRVTELERRPSPYTSSFVLEEIDAALDDGSSLALMLKHAGPGAATAQGHAAKPHFLRHPLRELLTYRDLLAPQRMGTATCYGVIVDPSRSEYALLLERVDGLPLCFVGEFETWRAAARWLGAFHTFHAGAVSDRAPSVPLVRYDRRFYETWIERAGAHHDLSHLVSRYSTVIERLEALPRTLLHGDFHAANILTQDSGGSIRVCPIDWELAAEGPGPIDLAALCAGQWSDAERRELARAYCDALCAGGGAAVDFDAFLETLDYCRLHAAVQWLGWTTDWTPPVQQRQDWMGVASELAARLNL